MEGTLLSLYGRDGFCGGHLDRVCRVFDLAFSLMRRQETLHKKKRTEVPPYNHVLKFIGSVLRGHTFSSSLILRVIPVDQLKDFRTSPISLHKFYLSQRDYRFNILISKIPKNIVSDRVFISSVLDLSSKNKRRF